MFFCEGLKIPIQEWFTNLGYWVIFYQMHLLVEVGIKSVLKTGCLQGKLALLSLQEAPVSSLGPVSSLDGFRNIWLLTWLVNQAQLKETVSSQPHSSIYIHHE